MYLKANDVEHLFMGLEVVEIGQVMTEFIALDWWLQQNLSLEAEY